MCVELNDVNINANSNSRIADAWFKLSINTFVLKRQLMTLSTRCTSIIAAVCRKRTDNLPRCSELGCKNREIIEKECTDTSVDVFVRDSSPYRSIVAVLSRRWHFVREVLNTCKWRERWYETQCTDTSQWKNCAQWIRCIIYMNLYSSVW